VYTTVQTVKKNYAYFSIYTNPFTATVGNAAFCQITLEFGYLLLLLLLLLLTKRQQNWVNLQQFYCSVSKSAVLWHHGLIQQSKCHHKKILWNCFKRRQRKYECFYINVEKDMVCKIPSYSTMTLCLSNQSANQANFWWLIVKLVINSQIHSDLWQNARICGNGSKS